MKVKIARIVKRLSYHVRSAFDRKLGEFLVGSGGLTVDAVLLERQIDDLTKLVNGRRVAPNLFTVKVSWDMHSNVPLETLKDLEHEVTILAIDHINNQRYHTGFPVSVTVEHDIYVTGVIVEPSFGCAEPGGLKSQPDVSSDNATSGTETVRVLALVGFPDGDREITLSFQRDWEHLTVGRAEGNALYINHESIANVHAILTLSQSGSIAVSDTGSGRDTFLNDRRLVDGEIHELGKRDVVTFGTITTRLQIVELC
jgi:hypothetical protein